MYEWIFATLIVFLASVLQAATGFGFAIMATPFLLLVFDSRDCIQISIILSFFISIVLAPKIRHEIDYVLLKRLILGSISGVLAGLLFFAYVSLAVLKIMVSVVILTATLFLLARGYLRGFKSSGHASDDLPGETELPAIDGSTKSFIRSLKDPATLGDLLVGLCAGTLTTSIGMPGVPLALYFNARNTKKEVIRSTTLAFFVAVYVVSIALQIITVKIRLSVLISSLVLIPAAAVGVLLGNLLFYKINQKMFQLAAYIILLYTGFYMLIKAI